MAVDGGFLDAPLPLAFAHRGGVVSARAAGLPENSAAAFAAAVAAGYRYVETDVHATADGVPVVFHDASLWRVAGVRGRLSRLRWADVRSLRVGGEPVVPRLADVLGAWPRVRFNVDVKSAAVVGPAVAAVRAAGAQRRVLWASFSDARLAAVRRLAGPGAVTSLGVRSVGRLRVAAVRGWRVRLPASVVAAQVPVSFFGVPVVGRRFVEYAHGLGLQVHVWTVDDRRSMEWLLDLGVDGIMTDRLDVLRDVLAGRGLWV
ncbi:glycerophosphodiester phosphodiesterase family protein [Pilimelia terevasa]|nr:glycerophosphodiester phosphodiesterase family protein [Pilimelia terevasa]